ncbi:MAG: ferritin-like domain-containing protein [Opitutaceae bacterium]|nr:ferritin-like domain-containing protein [Opitutaceae bacterium]
MSSALPSLRALLIDEIKDLHSAETQLTKALPKMIKAATHPELKTSLAEHLVETRGHVSRLVEALHLLDLPPKGKTCHAMKGLVEEAAEAISITAPSAVRDAALIGAAQRVEHYEMAGYGTARAFAVALEENSIASLLTATLDEEGAANEKLTLISIDVNAAALMADNDAMPPPKTRKSIRTARR